MKDKSSFGITLCLRLCFILSMLFSFGTSQYVSAAPLNAPAIPTLLTPSEGEIVYSTEDMDRASPIFTWEPIARTKTYQLQISAAIGFNDTTKLWTYITPNQAFVPYEANLPDNADLWWRVKVYRDATNIEGEWSPARTFRKNWLQRKLSNGTIVDNKPDLIYPNDYESIAYNETVSLSERPSFSWTSVPGATFYHLQFSKDPAFTTLYIPPALHGSVSVFSMVSTTYQLPVKFPDGTYYWRVVPKADGKIPATLDVWTGRESDYRTVSFNYNSTYIPLPQTPPNDPSLNSPLTFTPTFQWTAVRGAETYILDYSTSDSVPYPSPLTTRIETAALSYTPVMPMANNTNIYWHVRAVSGNSAAAGPDNWSPIWSFKKLWYLKTTLLTPVRGFAYTNEPFLSWTPVDGAVKYRVELSPSTSFTPVTTKITSNNFLIIPEYNCPNISGTAKRVHWRVTPIDSANNNGQTSDYFYYDCDQSAGAPVQVYPPYYYNYEPGDLASGELLNPREDPTVPLPVFYWKRLLYSDSTQAAAYRIQVSDDPRFFSSLWTFDTENMNAIPETKSLVPGLYYWRVRPRTGLGDSASDLGKWSQIWAMKFDPAKVTDLTPSGQPTELIRPSHNSEWAETVPLFEWKPVEGAAYYEIQIGSSSDPAMFESYLVEKAGSTSKTSPTGTAEYSSFSYPKRLGFATYYWRVRAMNAQSQPLAGLPGNWSNPYRFQVAAQSRWVETRTFGNNNLPVTISDPVGDMQNLNYDLGDLTITQDKLNWYFNFSANVSAADMRYNLYIDLDHKDGSGGTTDPEGYLVTTLPGHQPEYVISIIQAAGAFSNTDVWIHRWNGSGWDVPYSLEGQGGGDIQFSNGHVEMRISPGSFNIGAEEAGSMSVSLFTGMVTGQFWQALGHAQDTVPSDPNVAFATPNADLTPTVLTRFISVTDRPSIIYPWNKPANDPNAYWTIPPFSWHAPVNVPAFAPCGYRIRYALDPNLTNWTFTSTGTGRVSSYTFGNDLTGNDTYYWEARSLYFTASNGKCDFLGAWTEPATLDRVAQSVRNLNTTIENTMVRFNWDLSEGAFSYDIQISSDENFQTITYSKAGLGMNHHTPNVLSTENYVDGVTYYWRVRAKQDANVYDNYSTTASFVVQRGVPDGLVSIPGNDPTHAVSTNSTLCWNPVPGAYYYRVVVAYDDQFKTPVGSFLTEQRCYTISLPVPDGTFYWHVAIHDGRTIIGPFSVLSSFTKQYGIPTPLSPIGKAIGTPIFEWTPVQGANKYRLQVLHPLTNAVLKTYETVSNQYTPIEALNLYTYKWRVAMIDNCKGTKCPNLGAYSDEINIQDGRYFIRLPMLRK